MCGCRYDSVMDLCRQWIVVPPFQSSHFRTQLTSPPTSTIDDDLDVDISARIFVSSIFEETVISKNQCAVPYRAELPVLRYQRSFGRQWYSCL